MISLKGRIRKRFKDKEKLTRREKLRAISIACGPQEGANFMFAEAYREIMAKEGVTLNIKTTAGSAENLKLLQAESDGVEVAFVQGGLKSLVQNGHLMSLGSLFFEPLWIFHRPDLAIARTSDLKGMRLAVGEEGGGTKILATHFLGLNGINKKNTQLLSLDYQRAADMLLKGELRQLILLWRKKTSLSSCSDCRLPRLPALRLF
jgi:TRAP-type uncharacterized transport system substrate-binding protein